MRLGKSRGVAGKAITAVVLSVLVGLPGSGHAIAQDGTTIRVGSVEIGEGLTGAVDVTVENVEGLYGADVQLAFDAEHLEVVDANEAKDGVQIVLQDFLSPDLVMRDGADNDAGTIHFAATQLNPAEAKSGSGPLFSVVFRAKRPGVSSDVTVTSATLASRDGQRIPAETVGGRVTTVSAAAAPATPSPAPVREPKLTIGSETAVRPSDEEGGSSGEGAAAGANAVEWPTRAAAGGSEGGSGAESEGASGGPSTGNDAARPTESPGGAGSVGEGESPDRIPTADAASSGSADPGGPVAAVPGGSGAAAATSPEGDAARGLAAWWWLGLLVVVIGAAAVWTVRRGGRGTR